MEEAAFINMERRVNIVLIPYEPQIMHLQRLLVWDKPPKSAGLFIAVHLIFWLVNYLRPMIVVGIFGFCVMTCDLWVHYIWPEIRVPPPGYEDEEWTEVHPRILSVPEISSKISRALVYAKHYVAKYYRLRRTNHFKFFVVSMALWMNLCLLGMYVSGFTICYFSVMSVLLFPVIHYHNVISKLQGVIAPRIESIEHTMRIKRKRSKARRSELSTAVTESTGSLQLPVVTDSATLLLKEDSDSESGLTPRHTPVPYDDVSDSESLTSSLPSYMPSLTSMEDSLDPRFALPSHSQLSLGNLSDDDSLADGLSIGHESDVDGPPVASKSKSSTKTKQSLQKKVLLSQAASVPATTMEPSDASLSQQPLQFIAQYFKAEKPAAVTQQSTDNVNTAAPTKSQRVKASASAGDTRQKKKRRSEADAVEEELAQGLDFDSEDISDTEAAGNNNNNARQTAAVIAGERPRDTHYLRNIFSDALTGAQGAVTGEMVSSLMQSTVAGLSDALGLAASSGSASTPDDLHSEQEKGSKEERQSEKCKLGQNGSSQDSGDLDFEMLNPEDIDSDAPAGL